MSATWRRQELREPNRGLAIGCIVHDRQSPGDAVARADLGTLALDALARGDPEGARALLEHSVALKQAALGPHHRSLGDDLANLGNLLAERGDLVQARAVLQRALLLHAHLFG